MSDTRETIEPDRDAHNKLMAAFHEWWISGDAVILDHMDEWFMDALAEYRWIEIGRRCLWDQWQSGRNMTPGASDDVIARVTDAGCRALLEWMREAGK